MTVKWKNIVVALLAVLVLWIIATQGRALARLFSAAGNIFQPGASPDDRVQGMLILAMVLIFLLGMLRLLLRRDQNDRDKDRWQ